MAARNETTNKVISASITAVLMVLVFVITISFGYMPPDPPIPESGVEVNLGYSETGFGQSEQVDNGGATATPQPAPSQANEDISTQSTEESVALPSKPTPKPQPVKETPKQTPTKTEQKPKEPEINSNALFKKKGASNNNEGGSQGNTTGAGNMGQENGNPNATGYNGDGGNGRGNGIGYSLVGRKAKSLPEPGYNSQEQGKIVITVYVDRQGNVISAENSRGTTINDLNLVNQCIAAARKAKFSAASETSVGEKQKGTITYVFNRAN